MILRLIRLWLLISYTKYRYSYIQTLLSDHALWITGKNSKLYKTYTINRCNLYYYSEFYTTIFNLVCYLKNVYTYFKLWYFPKIIIRYSIWELWTIPSPFLHNIFLIRSVILFIRRSFFWFYQVSIFILYYFQFV